MKRNYHHFHSGQKVDGKAGGCRNLRKPPNHPPNQPASFESPHIPIALKSLDLCELHMFHLNR